MPRLAALLMLSCLAGLPARAASDKPPQTVGVESPSPNVGPDEPLDEEDESADEGGDTVVAGEEDTETPEVRRELDEHLRELEEEHRAEELSLPAIGAEPRNLRLLGPANPLRQRSDDDLGRDGVLVDEPGSPPAPIGVEPGDPLDELGGLDLPAVQAEYDIPVDLNGDVAAYLRFFQTSGRKWFGKWLARSHRWIPFERAILAEEGVPLDLVHLSMIESGFSPYAYSWAAASGLWQFISATGRRYGLRDDYWVDERRDPAKATRAAARYLRDLYREFGDWRLAWAGYNAGEGKIRRAIQMYGTRDFWQLAHAGRYLKPETKQYVPKLMAAAIVTKHPERFGFGEVEPEAPFEFDEVEVEDATEIALLASAAGITTEAFIQYNPALRRFCTPPARGGRGYVVKVPKGARDRVVAAIERIPPSRRVTFRHHRVKKGEKLSLIAAKYRTTGEDITQRNGLSGPKAVRPGQDLVVPVAMQVADLFADTGADWHETRRVARGKHGPRGGSGRGAGRYAVRKGDTLQSISRRFGVSVSDLRRWNRLSGGLGKTRSLVVSQPRAAGPKTAKAGKKAGAKKRRG